MPSSRTPSRTAFQNPILLMTVARSLFFALLLSAVFVGADPVAAQSSSQRMFLEGEQSFRWTDAPGEATGYVYREKVPDGETRGRIVGRTIADAAERLPQQVGKYIGQTALVFKPHPQFGGKALATEKTYPVEGQAVRYLLLIETAEGRLYTTRPTSNVGNYPRYHTLSGPDVRVDRVHRDLRTAARELLQRTKKSAEQKASAGTGSTDSSELDTTRREKITSLEGGETGEASLVQNGSAAEESTSVPSHDRAGENRTVLSPLYMWLGGSGVFGAIMFFFGMAAGRGSGSAGQEKSRNENSRPQRRTKPPSLTPQDSEDTSEGLGHDEVREIVETRVEERIEEERDTFRQVVLDFYKEEVVPLQERVQELENQIEDQEPETTPPEDEGKRQSVDQELASAFVEWCRKGGSQVRRVSRFREFLDEQIQIDEVRDIQYERDSTSDEFVDDARNGVTFWLVRRDGRQFVLPSPLTATEFDRLRPVFTGDANPETIEDIQPARLGQEAGRLVLQEQGKVW